MLMFLLVACLAPKTMPPTMAVVPSSAPVWVAASDSHGGGLYAAEPARSSESNRPEVARVASVPPASTLATTTSSEPRWWWPVSGRVTSEYGPRNGKTHVGLDVGAPIGRSVQPVSAGTVVHAGSRGGYGLLVVLDHGDGWRSRYGHLSEVLVDLGDELFIDDVLGLVGTTGNSTGPHLHLELRQNGRSVDPLTVLP